MESKELKVIIATRELILKKDDGAEEVVHVHIGKPVKTSDGNDWYCNFKISSDKNNETVQTIGIDSVQALFLANKTISVVLEHWENKYNGKFYFLDELGTCFDT